MRYVTKHPLPPMIVDAIQYDGLNGDSIRSMVGLNIKMLHVVGTWCVRLDGGNCVWFTRDEFKRRFTRRSKEFNPDRLRAKRGQSKNIKR